MTPLAPKCPLQLNDQGRLRHFLSLDGLPREMLTEILDTADSFLEVGARAVKKVPLMRGMTVCNVFFENSTRTRTTFELAAKRLSADVITLNVSTSSTSKGETLTDTCAPSKPWLPICLLCAMRILVPRTLLLNMSVLM